MVQSTALLWLWTHLKRLLDSFSLPLFYRIFLSLFFSPSHCIIYHTLGSPGLPQNPRNLASICPLLATMTLGLSTNQ